MKARSRFAFTVLELLIVVAIVGILTALALPAVGAVRRKAALSREVSSARQLMAAYGAYANDHAGDLLPGFGNFPATDERGDPVHSPVNYRYPWRLAPYLNYEMRLFWGSDSDDRIGKSANGPRSSYVYAVSVQPALGINAAFVGGDYQTLPPDKAKTIDRYGQFCVTRFTQALKPQSLIVFASAGADYQGERLSGYFKIEAPEMLSRRWPSTYSEKLPPDAYGHVDFRWDGKAVAAMLDGHVEVLTFAQMNDMRRWSNQAASANSAQWQLGNSDEPSGSSDSIDTGDRIDTKPTNVP